MNQQYIEGFIKRASEYGLDSNEAVELLKYSEELKGNQHKLDVDHDGKIESEDLQKLREKNKFTSSRNNISEFSKQAKINLEDIENNLGVYIRNKQQQESADEEVENAYKNSFILRHPYLTGIPTLGIAPAVANISALKKIKHNLLRKHPDLHKHVADVERAKYERELEMLPLRLEEERSRSKRHLMNTAALTGLLALDSYHRNKRHDE